MSEGGRSGGGRGWGERKIGYGQTLHSRKAIEWRQRMDGEGEEQLEKPIAFI